MTVSPWCVRVLGIRRAAGGSGKGLAGWPGEAAIVSARVGLVTAEAYGRRPPGPAGRADRRSEHVVAGTRLGRDWPRLCRDAAQPASLVVLERLDQLVPGVHHERAVRGDRFPDRLTAQQQDVEVLARPLLPLGGAERDRAAGPEDDELPGAHRMTLSAHGAVAGQDVAERVEVGPPRQPDLGAGGHGRVDHGD